MKTRNGIYYDLNNSTYKFKTPDTHNTFVFSSDLHMFKFEDQYLKHRAELNIKLKARYRINVHFNTLSDLILYQRIETRGFLVINEGGQKLCHENLILTGEHLTPKS